MPALRRISGELGLPEPARSRVILEMAADLEAMYEHFRARGLGEEEAARRAEDRVLASPDALRQLVLVHTTGYQRWLSGVAGRLRWGVDLLLFVLGVAPFLAIAALPVAAPAGRAWDDPALWGMVAAGAAIAGLASWKAHQLVVQRERSTVRLHRGLASLLFLGAMAPLLGAIGFLASLRGLVRMGMGAGGPAGVAAAEAIARGGTLLCLGILLGIAAGLVWFVLANRIATIEEAESAALLGA